MKRRRVTAYDDQGREVTSYPSVSAAARDRQVWPSSIHQSVRLGMRCGGLRWAREGDPAPVPDTRSVVAYNDAGEVAGTYPSQTMAAQALGVKLTALHHRLNGGRLRQGVRVRRAGDPAPGPFVHSRKRAMRAYDDAGTLVAEYPSRAEAARALGLPSASVAGALASGARLRGWRPAYGPLARARAVCRAGGAGG